MATDANKASMEQFIQDANIVVSCLQYSVSDVKTHTAETAETTNSKDSDNAPVSDSGALPNELSAPYEVPHFPIEKIETKKQQ